MNEKQLNENIIKLELRDICKDCIYLNRIAPIIREMLSKEYKTGLEQSRFDKNMLEKENQELKKKLEEKNKTKIFVEQNLEEAYGEGLYLEHLENKNQKYKEVIDKSYIRVMHLLDYYDHYRVLPKSIIEELINLQIDLDILKEVE